MFKSEATLDEIEQAIPTNPLTAIDMIIEKISNTNHEGPLPHSNNLLTLFSQAVLLSQNVDESSWKDDPKLELFNRELGHHTRYFIGVCLLRLLASCGQCFQTDFFRHKIFDLFDDVFLNELYKLYNITKNDQTYAKESKLKDVVPSIEREISITITSFSHLDSLSLQSFRKSFMDVIMNKKAQIIIFPFSPKIHKAL